MVLSSCFMHCESSPGSSGNCRLSAKWPPTLRPSHTNPHTKPTDLGCESTIRQLPYTSTIAILLLLSPKADNHFTIPKRVES